VYVRTYVLCGLSVCGHVVLLVWDISLTDEKIPLKPKCLVYCTSLPCDLFSENPFCVPFPDMVLNLFPMGCQFTAVVGCEECVCVQCA